MSMLVTLVLALAVLNSTPPAQRITITAAARAIQPGELVVLTIVTRTPATEVRVRAFARDWQPFRVDGGRWRVLVGIDLDVAPGRYDVAVETGAGPETEAAIYPLVVKPRVFRTRHLTVHEGFVNPPAEVTARIQEDVALLESIWRSSASSKLWTGAFIRPVPDRANSAFGTRSVYNGQPRSPHGGADFQSAAGTRIKAPNAGRVVLARDLYFTGNTVVIDHGLGLFSLLAHLSAIGVQEGDAVGAGDLVGRVGATGRVTGPHLHWTVRAGDARIDPLSLLAVLGPKVRRR
jgi:murein DD-endopeptidase MepM/ murein hydrolase activator NlpD